MLLGGYVGQAQIEFGSKALRLPAKAAPAATVRVLQAFVEGREPGELFASWLERSGGAGEVGKGLADLGVFPEPAVAPDYYVDYDETAPYIKEVGASECAT